MNALYRDLAQLAAAAERRPVPAKWRPGFHLAPPVGWLNDPNGLCKFGGLYHVFYQYAPFNARGGVKLWGHYESPDLLHWRQRPAALFPDEPFDCHGVYSGSALAEEDGLYLYYTGNVKLPESAGQSYDYITAGREHNTVLAYSPDGETFRSKRLLMENSDYPAGLTCHVRDPKVWKDRGRCYMLQGARTAENRGEALLFASEDRVHWSHVNTLTTQRPFGYMWECPDLYALDGTTVLSVSPQGVAREETRLQNLYQSGWFPLTGDYAGEYALGAFTEYDYGFDFYAPQTFSDGQRRLMIGWMGMPDVENEYTNPTVDLGWQYMLTVPRELAMEKGVLRQRPARELAALRSGCIAQTVAGRYEAPEQDVFDLELALESPVRVTVRDCAEIRWADGLLSLSFRDGGCGRTIRRARVDRLRNLRLLADASSLELFVNDGETVMTSLYYPAEGQKGLQVECAAGALSLWKMNPMEITR